jgi:hypothetical protein
VSCLSRARDVPAYESLRIGPHTEDCAETAPQRNP